MLTLSMHPLLHRSDQLFNLWNKYEHKLSKAEFQSKLLEMGDFLISIQVRENPP